MMRPVPRAEDPSDARASGPQFLVAAAYEVLFMLVAAVHPRRYELARGWGVALQRRLSPQARATWRALFGHDGALGARPALLVERLAPPGTVADLVALVHALPPEELALVFLGDAADNPAAAEAATRLARGQAMSGASEAALTVALAALRPPAPPLRRAIEDLEGTRRAYAALLEEADRHVLAAEWPGAATNARGDTRQLCPPLRRGARTRTGAGAGRHAA